MTADTNIHKVLDALALPPDARVDARVPKKLLVEQGAPTAADKRAIQDGIDELKWFAACKPVTIGVPSFKNDVREYLEIAVVGCAFRHGTKPTRLIELIHRAIPYPVLLITASEGGLTISAAHKRHAQNEVNRTVIEHIVAVPDLRLDTAEVAEKAFLHSLALVQQPRADLFALYDGWQARIEALSAARLTGVFTSIDNAEDVNRRRAALAVHIRLTKEIENLRSKAKREKKFNRRMDLSMAIQRIEAERAANMKNL